MTQALYRKWRPHRWEQVIGQQHVVQTLRNAVAADRVAHAYLFAGPRGTGKTTTARLLAKAVNCLEPDLALRPCDQCEHCQAVDQGRFLDLIEIDAASNTSVDDVRDLRDKINFSPNKGRYKIYIVDEVHMLSTAAFNALLKTLEEPPPHAIFVLATTEVHKIPATVLSRCQRHEFRRIPVNDIVAHLREVAAEEGIAVAEEALTLIARQATGAMRDAISLLDQLASASQEISLEMTQSVLGTATNQLILEIVDAVLAQDAAAGLESLHQALDAGSDARQFARQIVDYLRDLLLVRMGNVDQVDATAEIRAQMARHTQSFTVSELLRLIQVFTQAAHEIRNTWQPALPLEIAFIEAINSASKLTVESQVEQTVKPLAAEKTKRKPAERSKPRDAVPEKAGATPDTAALPVPGAPVTLEAVTGQWRNILSRVRRQSPNTEALLRSGKLLGIKENALYFGLSAVLKEKMEKGRHIELVEEVLQEIFQRAVLFHCVVSTGKAGDLPPEIDGDGMVAAALRDLGGEIVDVQ